MVRYEMRGTALPVPKFRLLCASLLLFSDSREENFDQQMITKSLEITLQ